MLPRRGGASWHGGHVGIRDHRLSGSVGLGCSPLDGRVVGGFSISFENGG